MNRSPAEYRARNGAMGVVTVSSSQCPLVLHRKTACSRVRAVSLVGRQEVC